MGRPFTDEEKKEIQNKIINVANELFRLKGFDEVKVSDITRKVGIAKGSFYSFFDCKEALLIAIIEQIEQQFHARIIELMVAEPDKKKMLIKILQIIMEEARGNYLISTLFSENKMREVYRNVPESKINALFNSDESLLLQLAGDDLKLLVPLATAVDMMRSLFYIQSFAEDFKGDISTFNNHMIVAIINEIFE